MRVFFIFVLLLVLLLPCRTYNKHFHKDKILNEIDNLENAVRLLETELLYNYERKRKKEQLRQNVVHKTTVFTFFPEHPGLNRTAFPKVKTEQTKAKKVESDNRSYKWAGRVMHSADSDDASVYLCTASCIEERIFVTAARCIYHAKVLLTRVVFRGDRLPAIAFVMPSNPTKAMFDDIGFIIVNDTRTKWKWIHTDRLRMYTLSDNAKFIRTDDHFFWFGKFTNETRGGSKPGVAMGYVQGEDKSWALYYLEVFISPFLCQHFYNTDILKQYYKSDNFFVPCYHTCDMMDGYKKVACAELCIAGEGHVVLVDSKLVGIVTWGGYYTGFMRPIYLPVGMAVVNSRNFEINLQCAQKIKKGAVTRESFSELCSTTFL